MDKVYNWLRPNAFRLLIQELPNVSFTCQSATLPQLMFGSARQPTPFIDVNHLGDKLVHGDFTISMIIDENLTNYMEIYDWMVGIGFPNNYDEFSLLINNRGSKSPMTPNSHSKYTKAFSDMNLSVLDSDNNTKIEFVFKDAFPIEMSQMLLTVIDNDVQYLTCDVTFKYTMFIVNTHT